MATLYTTDFMEIITMILKNTWSCNILTEWELKPEDVKLASTYQKPGEDNQGLKLSNNPHTLRAKINVLF